MPLLKTYNVIHNFLPSTTAKVFVALLSLLSCLDCKLFNLQLLARLLVITFSFEEPIPRRKPRFFGLSPFSSTLLFVNELLLNCFSFSLKRTARPSWFVLGAVRISKPGSRLFVPVILMWWSTCNLTEKKNVSVKLEIF